MGRKYCVFVIIIVVYDTTTEVPAATSEPVTSMLFGPTVVPNALIRACISAAEELLSIITLIVPAVELVTRYIKGLNSFIIYSTASSTANN